MPARPILRIDAGTGDRARRQLPLGGVVTARKVASTSELRRVEIASGKDERLVRDMSFTDTEPFYTQNYDVSPDDREVVFARRGPDGTQALWLAPLDRGSPARAIVQGGSYPSFGTHDDLFFVAVGKDTNSLTRIKKDGSEREGIGGTSPLFSRGGISPDGEWAILFGRPVSGSHEGTMAVPTHGGRPKLICTGLCWAWWSGDGRTFYVNVYDESAPERTLIIPVPPGAMVPDLPALGVNDPQNQNGIAGLRVIERGLALPLPNSNSYVFVKSELLRNLYRVPLH